jgi:Flp pilus assembly protein TadD
MFWPKAMLPTDRYLTAPATGQNLDARLVWGGYAETLLDVCRALRLAEWSEAEALLMRAAPLAGDDPAFWNLVGVTWEVRGDSAAARRFYGKAIRADSNYGPAQQNMRRVFELRRFGRTSEAVALGDE